MTASYAYSQPSRVSAGARERVARAAAELGYAGPDPSARSLRRGRTSSLGVVLGEHLAYAFDDPQASAFLGGVAEVCGERGYAMTILPTTGDAHDTERIRIAAVDGFVVWTTVDDDPVLDAIRRLHLPAVVHSGPAVEGLGLVGINNRKAARAIGALAFQGSRRPAVLSFPLDRARVADVSPGRKPTAAAFPVTRDRLLGFRDAARRTGHPWSAMTVAVCGHNQRAEAEQVTSRLLATDRPDAIAAMSDELAAGAITALRAAGLRVPDDCAVTGWDDAPVAADLGLTTVAQSMRDQGAQCATAVLDRKLTSLPEPPWSLRERSSTRRGAPA
jgi:DNA-binding LacI/PurR family transcriptional regulator